MKFATCNCPVGMKYHALNCPDPVYEVMGCWQPKPIDGPKRQRMLDELLVGLRDLGQDFDRIEWRDTSPRAAGWVAVREAAS